ncbi:hypothetical protein [Wenyingzhuangia marina]|uniref:50S ribosomal protein L27 n=1 Tax=Wenyingzhuangia marina TaxID=1195760 RepID=A0A1M5SKI4_9FLAO|nr:hypothetical protein [Wenyingzhuangia marina]GGF62693.1 hypothetical protein GCM10011397_02200 [Wenyingzhuangia marina]SHH38975.1 hypothetical protein SAMN05444281_0360 [Wenyingzhuangia marina]
MRTVHSILAAFALIAIAMVVFNAVMSLKREEKFKAGDRKLGLIALILTHTQFLVGLITYYVSPWYETLRNVGMGNAMKNAELRLMSVEHPLTMIIAIALITVGWSRHKKLTDDKAKFKSFAIFYGLGLILILARIPWSHWF